MRLLICHTCKTIEEVPDYDGPLEYADVPAPDGTLMKAQVPPVGADHLLEHISEPHRRQEHIGQLVGVDEENWRDTQTRVEILKQIKDQLAGGSTGLHPEAYALKDTFKEDALKCYSKHGRPKDGCVDWHDRSKVLGNSLLTDEERTAARKRGLTSRKKRFLCDFCPVASQVQQKIFDKGGLYK
jgi:hypothetical protein